MKYVVTGAAGFIGSHIVDLLLAENNQVIALDNLSTGHYDYIIEHESDTNFQFYNFDLAQGYVEDWLKDKIRGADAFYHFAANADIRFGLLNPEKDLEQGIVVTFNVLEIMRELGIKKIVYASSAAVYGEPTQIPTSETYPGLQTSIYGASKLSSEALIQAYCAGYDMYSWIFRFSSVLGERYNHGVVYNFYRELKRDPSKLYVHGGKHQRKSYVYIDDVINGIWAGTWHAPQKVNIFNVGNESTFTLDEVIRVMCETMELELPEIIYSGNKVGWIGDSRTCLLEVAKLKSFGWKPEIDIAMAINKTVHWLSKNQWIFTQRA